MAKAFSMLGFVFLLTSACFPARAQDKAPPKAEQLQRLSALCKVWGTVRYQHPYLACKDIDWDAALIRALPKIEAAKTPKEFAAAVQTMLDVLQDPVTRVVGKQPPAKAPPPADVNKKPGDGKWFTRPADGILGIDVSTLPDWRKMLRNAPEFTEFQAEIKKARGLVIDCRRVSERATPSVWERVLPWLPFAREVKGIGTRHVVHSGYRSQTGPTYGGYYSAFETAFRDVFTPIDKYQGPRSVWLVSEQSGVPDVALALQCAGDSFIVVQGKASADRVVPQRSLPLVEGFAVLMRTAELVTPEGGGYPFQADAEVAADAEPGTDGPAYQAALALLKDAKPGERTSKASQPLPSAVWRPDKSYSAMNFPDREHRLLALFRFWNVIHYFYPYKHLLDRDWDTVLPEFLPKFLAAGNERDYALAVAEMAARTQDNHTRVSGSAELAEFFGRAPPPLAVRWIEGAPVVVWFRDEKTAKAAGVLIGDVVVKVDGETVAERIERHGKYLSVSRPNAQPFVVTSLLLNGAEGSVCKLTLRGADGKEKEAELPRRYAFYKTPLPPPAQRDVFEILPGNLGYVDLTRLEKAQIDGMLEKLKGTKAIIFDMRGYPGPGVFAIAPRLNVKNAKYSATFHRPLVSGRADAEMSESSLSFLQPIPATNRWQYQGKTAMLIDERAVSASEHLGLYLEAGSGTTFIGSHTAGANGDVTDMVLPGGLTVLFGGHDVRHADGRQLQRVGLVPHIEVTPTIKGIREDTDEVLERAIKFMQEGK